MVAMTIPVPQTVGDLGIRRSFLEDLALKILYLEGEMSVTDLARKMGLSFAIIDEVFQALRREQLCEVKGMVGSIHRITTTSQGKERALGLLSQSQYAGLSPVSFRDYVGRVREQSVRDADVHPPELLRAFEHLVLSNEMLRQLGTAVVSGTSIVLYGSTGTGKTAIAECIPSIYQDRVWIPYAVEIDGQVIVIYDPIVHKRVDTPPAGEGDRRWVLCERPRVIVGGELTIDMLDLQFNPVAKFYSAPVQMKANNGVLIVDDFGRQRIRPEELLNRWTVPLDRRIDFLTMAGGRKLEIPFDLFVVFATNLDPAQLADEAFLRRIHNKISVDPLPREQFHEVFSRLCQEFELAYDPAVVDHLVGLLTTEFNQPLRGCYPLDVIRQIRWAALYEGKPARLDRKTVEQACRNYFLAPGAQKPAPSAA